MIEDIVVIIPAYNPDEKFISFLDVLKKAGYRHIIVIDDGSRKETKKYFEAAKSRFGCWILTHSINLGQGRAYKTGFNYYLSECHDGGIFHDTIGLVQCDCDGQHLVEDVTKCVSLLRNNPKKFILGVRDFSDKSIPFRSRFGNNCTTFVFKALCGLDINDTQTGLKGIPASFVPTLMETQGERFEYASSVLLETKKHGVEILQFPIQTIYINGNETSHFNPLLDSFRIYSLILKYLMSSFSAFLVDILVYSFLIAIFYRTFTSYYIVISTYIAKAVSCTYTYFVNKGIVFENKSGDKSIVLKFIALCIVQATMSGFLTTMLVDAIKWNEVVSKIMIDTILFFFSFQVQNRWVFKVKN